MPLLIRVAERMRAPKAADVLARIDPAKAKQVTAEAGQADRAAARCGEWLSQRPMVW
jgi:hypothetical protein